SQHVRVSTSTAYRQPISLRATAEISVFRIHVLEVLHRNIRLCHDRICASYIIASSKIVGLQLNRALSPLLGECILCEVDGICGSEPEQIGGVWTLTQY